MGQLPDRESGHALDKMRDMSRTSCVAQSALHNLSQRTLSWTICVAQDNLRGTTTAAACKSAGANSEALGVHAQTGAHGQGAQTTRVGVDHAELGVEKRAQRERQPGVQAERRPSAEKKYGTVPWSFSAPGTVHWAHSA